MHQWNVGPIHGNFEIFPKRQAYFKFIDKYDWYIGASFLESEIYGPLSLVRVLIVVFTLIIFILCVAVATGFSEYINRHINRLINAYGQGAAGDLNTRYDTLAGDEFGQLAHYFNTFMARIESNRQSLVEEIEKRRQMQQVIHESEKRLKTLVKNAPVLLWAVDAAGMLTFFEGNLPAQFIEEIQISDEMPVADSLRTMGPPMDGLADHIENALIGNPGSLQITFQGFAIEIHSNPFYNDQHQLIGVVGVAIDVTSRWQAERRFSKAEKERLKLAMAVEQADEIIFITDTAGTIEYVNPAFEKSSGYTKSETIGHRPNILKSGRHNDAFYKKLWLTISNGKTWSSRIINRKKDGTLFYEDATISPMRDKNGKIVNYVASKRDVTQEVILDDQLEHSQRMKAIGTLAGGIAHDFNNILSGIMGYADLCLYDAPKPSLLSDQLGKILESLNYRVSARSSTTDALKLFQSAPDRFDLVYTDLTLPDMDGIAFSLEVRQLIENMPIVISSGFSDDAKLDAMRKQGLMDFINKPIIRNDVARKIASLLHQARSSASANTL